MYKSVCKACWLFLSLLVGCLAACSHKANVVITEVLSSNTNTVVDEFGSYSDWIELENASRRPLNLEGYGLSDDPEDPYKWRFPSLTFAPGEKLVVWASGEDRTWLGNHLETVIDTGADWKYWTGSDPPEQWHRSDFDDASWSVGASPFGYGDEDDVTLLEDASAVYIRAEIHIADLEPIRKLMLSLDVDDGYIAFVNGVEVARKNMDGVEGTSARHDQLAARANEARTYRGLAMDRHYRVDASYLKEGTNTVAIQAHNYTVEAVPGGEAPDLTLLPIVNLEYVVPPANGRGPAPLILPSIRQLHTSFSLDRQGESLVVTHPNGTILDRVELLPAPTGTAQGRSDAAAGETGWFYLATPTPGTSNSDPLQGWIEPFELSPAGGIRDAPLFVGIDMSTVQDEVRVHYTTDGSEPTLASPVLLRPIEVTSSTVIRARAFAPGWIPSDIVTDTYLIGEQYALPIVSLVTDPKHLWDDEAGIYVLGKSAVPDSKAYGANFRESWTREAHLEFFDGASSYSAAGGIEIYGGLTRTNPRKSFEFKAQGAFGRGEIRIPFFDEDDRTARSAILLRAAGNDWNKTLFRDALVQHLFADGDFETQNYRPVVLLVNGDYWGIYNVREKMDDSYISDTYGLDDDAFSIQEGYVKVSRLDGAGQMGDVIADAGVSTELPDHSYSALIDYVNRHDVNDPAVFQRISSEIDLESFVAYHAAQIYVDNKDWPGRNIRYWKPHATYGKWRWMMYDTDFAFALFEQHGSATDNTLQYALAANGANQNSPGATLLLRKLLENHEIRRRLMNRLADYANGGMAPERVLHVIDKFAARLLPEIPRHLARWGVEHPWNSSVDSWLGQVQVVRQFAIDRPQHIRRHVVDTFALDGMVPIMVRLEPESAGTVRVNSLAPSTFPWEGIYFEGVPIDLEAIPMPGHRFVGWVGGIETAHRSVRVDPAYALDVTAVFAPTHEFSWPVVTEISARPTGGLSAGDWIELYNPGDATIDLSAFMLRDSHDDHTFVLPSPTYLAGGDRLVLCEDSRMFGALYGGRTCIGDWTFGLKATGERVRLYTPREELVMEVVYQAGPPWPHSAIASGRTLELKTARLDPDLPGNWGLSRVDGGTPGRVNSISLDQARDAP